ncbi:hypothetical protein [Luteolibacter yonseiensis]
MSGRTKFLILLGSLIGAGAAALHLMPVKQMPRTPDHGPGKNRGVSESATPVTGSSPVDLRKKPGGLPGERKGDIPDDITPDRAKTLMEDFFKRTAKLEERKAFASALIRKLCEAGFSDGAWEVIPEDRSHIRSAMLRDYFAHARLPQRDLLARIGDMNSEISDVFKGYLSRFSPADLAEVLTSPDLQNLVARMGRERAAQLQISRHAGEILGKQLADDPAANAAVIRTAEELKAKGLLSAAGYVSVVVRDRTLDAFQQWEKLKSVTPGKGEDREMIQDEKKETIRGMVQKNAPHTMDHLLRSTQPDRKRDIGSAVDHWLWDDPKAATDWYEKNLSRLVPADRDLITATYADEIIDSGDIERAQAWIERIQDPAAKEQASGKLAEMLEMRRRHEEEQKQKEAGK